MRAVAVTEPNRVEIVEVGKPSPGPYQALVRTEVAFLCNATDGKLIDGTFPGVEDYPLMLGHESAGIVEAVGKKVRNFKVGDRAIGGLVFEFDDPKYSSGWGGFGDYTLCNDHDAMVEDGIADEEHGWFECYEIQRAVDSDISPEAAGLLCTWREVLGAFGDFQLSEGDDILIFGGGPVGLSFARFGKLMGLGHISLVDPHVAKREKAEAMGADETFDRNDDLEAVVKRRGKPFDVVIDAVGSPAIINKALPLIRMGGTIGVYGVIGDETFTLEKNKGPYNFNLFIHQWPTRHREHAAQASLCQWIRDGRLKPEEFITHEFPIEQINNALDAVRRREVIKALLRY
ncbi:MAG: zinc-binding dehydrogenase [Fuerstiella sp.]|nr:zinc-binding dehydrogenase [Fuerstiella sp.]MCP4859062.1 zinc-binding dehydrogenase [Fuerstiella sp.]